MDKAPLSVRVIHVFTSIAFWLMILVAIAVFVLNILTQFKVIGDDFQLRVALPVQFDVEETGTMPVMSEIQDVRIEEAIGRIHVINTPRAFSLIVLRVLFVVVALGLFITWKFKVFIENIKNGDIFIQGNINNLKQMSYALVIVWFIEVIYSEVLYHTTVKFIHFETLDFYETTNYGRSTLLIALVIWVLAHVFEKGRSIQEENQLTI